MKPLADAASRVGVPHTTLCLRPMAMGDLDAVLQIETGSYSHPWTRGNFVDSLVAGHETRVILGDHHELLAYCVTLAGVDELHLLNLTVARAHRRRGLALRLLGEVQAIARSRALPSIWLEVRAGNDAARALYTATGFTTVGVRPGYYPAAAGREDAVLMSLQLTALPAAKG